MYFGDIVWKANTICHYESLPAAFPGFLATSGYISTRSQRRMKTALFVIPAKAGIQVLLKRMNSCLPAGRPDYYPRY